MLLLLLLISEYHYAALLFYSDTVVDEYTDVVSDASEVSDTFAAIFAFGSDDADEAVVAAASLIFSIILNTTIIAEALAQSTV